MLVPVVNLIFSLFPDHCLLLQFYIKMNIPLLLSFFFLLLSSLEMNLLWTSVVVVVVVVVAIIIIIIIIIITHLLCLSDIHNKTYHPGLYSWSCDDMDLDDKIQPAIKRITNINIWPVVKN